MIKVLVQSNGKEEKELKFKDPKKALAFMYMANKKGMFILSYYGETDLDDCDIWWLNNRINLSALNTLALNYYKEDMKK